MYITVLYRYDEGQSILFSQSLPELVEDLANKGDKAVASVWHVALGRHDELISESLYEYKPREPKPELSYRQRAYVLAGLRLLQNKIESKTMAEIGRELEPYEHVSVETVFGEDPIVDIFSDAKIDFFSNGEIVDLAEKLDAA